MTMSIIIKLCLIYVCCLPLSSQAQIDIVIAGESYHMNNVVDNAISPSLNQFVKDGVIPSIKLSKYDVEIRCNFYGAFGWFPGEGHCIVIRGNRKTLQAIDYSVRKYYKHAINGKLEDSGRVLHQYDYPQNPWGIGVHVIPLKPPISLTMLLQRLMACHINDIPDEDEIVNRLSKQGVFLKEVQCNDCLSSFWYEVKIGDHYRSFSISNRYQTTNLNIPEINYERGIVDVFNTLVPKL